jgi:hypothetical protein
MSARRRQSRALKLDSTRSESNSQHFWTRIWSGTDVTIFKTFLPKYLAKKLPFLNQNKAKSCKILIITLVFEKKFFGENWRKSQKLVIILSTPGGNDSTKAFFTTCERRRHGVDVMITIFCDF